ncbi:hypothetical protein DyAD56_02165 [Dyella sp. AD56]|uniref:hypothetical protein n=1 Tax=Dyella sp. AD56 TaxID=1528744 RepID=UPI000C83981A|nr:hypothetical protein [Dyella sp. AD56]PMQ07551.1 hypothetical protein DyAD56_02165 [Dyella sp. AD56]
MPSLAQLANFSMYAGGALVFGTLCTTLVGARFAESIKPRVMTRLKRAARAAYASAMYLFASGLFGSLLIEVSMGISSQTSRAGGSLTVLQSDSPLLFWLLTALKDATVLFIFHMAYAISKDPKFD